MIHDFPAFARILRRLHAGALGVVLAALVSNLSSACGPPISNCQQGQARCNRDTAMNCNFMEDGNGSYFAWREDACGARACNLDHQGAFCVLALDPNCGLGLSPLTRGRRCAPVPCSRPRAARFLPPPYSVLCPSTCAEWREAVAAKDRHHAPVKLDPSRSHFGKRSTQNLKAS